MSLSAETTGVPADPANEAELRRSRAGDKPVRRESTLVIPAVFKWVVSYAGFIAIVLAQFGYTMALAVESTFGIGRDSLLSDWSYIVSLGAPLLLQTVASAAESLNGAAVYIEVIRYFGGTLIVVIACALLRHRFRAPLRRAIPSVSLRLSADTKRLCANLGMVTLGMLGAVPAMLLLLVALALPVVGIPAFWRESAKEYLYKAVIEPDYCLPVHNLAERRMRHSASVAQLEGSAVLCLSVVSDGQRELGRLVISGANYVVLYNPDTGRVRRIGTDGAVVEAVASLE